MFSLATIIKFCKEIPKIKTILSKFTRCRHVHFVTRVFTADLELSKFQSPPASQNAFQNKSVKLVTALSSYGRNFDGQIKHRGKKT